MEAKRYETDQSVIDYVLKHKATLGGVFNSSIEGCSEFVAQEVVFELVLSLSGTGSVTNVFHDDQPFTLCVAAQASNWQLAAPPYAGIMMRVSLEVSRQEPSQPLEAFIDDVSL